MTTTELTTKYNNDSTGLFKAGQNRGIGSDKMRSLVTDIVATFLDQLSIMSSVIASGTNTYTGSLPLVILSYTNYMKVYVKIQNTSTGASTLNLSAVGAKKIFITPSVQASAGDLIANQWYLFSYDAALDAAAGGWVAIGLGEGRSGVSSVSTAGGTITLDFLSAYKMSFIGSASFSTPKTIAHSNAGNAAEYDFMFEITNVAAKLTFPAAYIMSDARWEGSNPQEWEPTEVGKYKATATYDGINWWLEISAAPYV